MFNPRSLLKLGVPPVVGLLSAVWLGWLFHRAYLGLLGDEAGQTLTTLSLTPGPWSRQFADGSYQTYLVVRTTLLFLALAGAVLLLGSIAARRWTRAARIVAISSLLVTPLAFLATAVTCRHLLENGKLTPSALDLKLNPGEFIVYGGLEIRETGHGLAIRNLGDSRAVSTIVAAHLQGLWTFHGAFIVFPLALMLGASLRLGTMRRAAKPEHAASDWQGATRPAPLSNERIPRQAGGTEL